MLEYIVLIKKDNLENIFENEDEMFKAYQKDIEELGIQVNYCFKIVGGFILQTTEDKIEKLKKKPYIKHIEITQEVTIHE